MDYILRRLTRRIEYCERSVPPDAELGVLYRARIEYSLLFLLGYLWNRNLKTLDAGAQAYLLKLVQRPSVGTIVDLCRRLDLSKNLSQDKNLSSVFNQWPALRNETLGHGYVFQDSAGSNLDDLRALASKLDNIAAAVLPASFDLITVEKTTKDLVSGTLYTSDGEYYPFHVACESLPAQQGNLYARSGESVYDRISPFVRIDDEDNIFVFRSIKEPLTGAVIYNRLLRTGTATREWPELANVDLEVEGVRRVTANTTVLNTFDLNYKKYIDVGLRAVILDFILKNSASVCAKIWGHGGVGKTATVQAACEYLTSSGLQKKFDYIVFASAKDRSYNPLTGAIQSIPDANRVNTFEGVVRLATFRRKNEAVWSDGC